MYRPYTFFVGLRYTGEKRSNQLVSFISLVSIAGMMLGVALLIVVLSVMNGFDKEMRTRILGLVPHIAITAYGDQTDWPAIREAVLQHPKVMAAAPFIQINAMLLRGSDVEPVLVYGIDPELEKTVSIIEQFVDEAALKQLTGRSNSIVMGAALAKRLNLTAGDDVNLMVPEQSMRASNQMTIKRLRIVALLDSGTEIDQGIALLNFDTARSLSTASQLTEGMRIKVTDTFQAPRVAWEIEHSIPYGYSAVDWTRTHGNLYSAIRLSKQLVGLMLLTIIAVAAFNVVSALVMIVTDKRGDIAILRTAGASPSGVMMIFMVQGTLIGCIGTALGVLLGIAIAFVLTDGVVYLEQLFNIQFLNSDVYPINYVPVDIRIGDVMLVCVTALVMSILATLYPAWRAANVHPAEALRYE